MVASPSAGVLLLLSVAQTPAVFALLVVLYYLFYGVSDPLYVALAELVYPERTGTSWGERKRCLTRPISVRLCWR